MRARGRRIVGLALVLAGAAGCRAEGLTVPDVEGLDGEPGAPVFTLVGTFRGVSHETSGTVTYALDDAGAAALSLSADFTAPDVGSLEVLLANSTNPEQAIRVARLEGAQGPRRWTFRMPRGAVWRHVLLWSDDLGVLVAVADLAPAG